MTEHMLKYTDTKVTFSEVPDEIALCINISGCPLGCEGCHSSYLAGDIGEELTPEALDSLIEKNRGITAVSFMGGDRQPFIVNDLAGHIKASFPELKTCWYSGRDYSDPDINPGNFNFIKLGPYMKDRGGLDRKTTNQKFYKVEKSADGTYDFIDITYKFQKHE